MEEWPSMIKYDYMININMIKSWFHKNVTKNFIFGKFSSIGYQF